MRKQEKEKIKKAANDFATFKKKRKAAGIKLLKSILVSGLALLCWTFSMLLVLIIVDDPQEGAKVFLEVNGMLYNLYAILVGVGIFIYLVEYIFKKKDYGVKEIIVEEPANYKYKK